MAGNISGAIQRLEGAINLYREEVGYRNMGRILAWLSVYYHQVFNKGIIHLFVLSCEKATFLVEKQLYTSLLPLERLQLRIHLSICKIQR